MAQFFSFGTNDLTQMTFGISRDDAEKGFLIEYIEKKILPENPFAVDRPGRRGQADGHGRRRGPRDAAGRWTSGSAASTAAIRIRSSFCHKIGLDYVVLLALPRADRAPGGGACGAGREEVDRRKKGIHMEAPAAKPGLPFSRMGEGSARGCGARYQPSRKSSHSRFSSRWRPKR